MTVYELLHNIDARFERGGTPEDRYLFGHRWYIDDTRENGDPYLADEVADMIYAKHQRDDRPDGDKRPALSVGDVIVMERFMVEDYGPMRIAVTVDLVGFQPVGIPPKENILANYPEGYFEERRVR